MSDTIIDACGLTKRYGKKTAVEGLRFSVRPGLVTGFVGPNGAGKSTTMRMILGLDAPTSGTATIGGRRMAELKAPMRTVGALLDARAVHPSRTAFDHLLAIAQAGGMGRRRVKEVLEMVGLTDAAHRRAGEFSLGMGQRLGIATALLGDPAVLILDEPINGLDPEGIRWARNLMRQLADEGRTVLVSSHLMAEMELIAQQLIVIGMGRLIADTGLEEFVRSHTTQAVLVRAPETRVLADRLSRSDIRFGEAPESGLLVKGASAKEIGKLAAAGGIELEELTPVRDSLEDVVMRLTSDAVEYGGRAA